MLLRQLAIMHVFVWLCLSGEDEVIITQERVLYYMSTDVSHSPECTPGMVLAY